MMKPGAGSAPRFRVGAVSFPAPWPAGGRLGGAPDNGKRILPPERACALWGRQLFVDGLNHTLRPVERRFYSCSAQRRGSKGKPLSRSEGLCAVQFEAVRQHDDGLGAALAFVHRKTDRLSLVREQPAAQAFRVPDDPASETILPDVEARAGRGCCLNRRLLNHFIWLCT